MKTRIKILAAGIFLAALIDSFGQKPANLLDPTFDPGTGPNSTVVAVAVQADGKIVIGGEFTEIDGTPRRGIARLNADGSLDREFDPKLTPSDLGGPQVSSVALQSDGKVLIFGGFSRLNGVSRNGAARLNPDGSLDASFTPPVGDWAWGLLQADGKVLLRSSPRGAWFVIPQQPVEYDISRLNPDWFIGLQF